MQVWPGGLQQRYAYSMAVMALQYFLPLAILSFTYVNIAVVIWVKRAPGEAEHSRDRRLAASKRKVLPTYLPYLNPLRSTANPLSDSARFRSKSIRCPRVLTVHRFHENPIPLQSTISATLKSAECRRHTIRKNVFFLTSSCSPSLMLTVIQISVSKCP